MELSAIAFEPNLSKPDVGVTVVEPKFYIDMRSFRV